MVRIALNIAKPNNYAFFCPISRLHLTRSNPAGTISEVTPYILRGLKSKVLIDVDNVIDLETGNEKAAEQKQQAPVNPQPIQNPVPPAPTPDQKESASETQETKEPEAAPEPETAEPEKVETPEEAPAEAPATPAEETPLPVDAIPAAEEKTTKKGGRKKTNA